MKEIIRISEYDNYSLFFKDFDSLTIDCCFRKIFNNINNIFYDDFTISFVACGKSGGGGFFEFEITIDLPEELVKERLEMNGYDHLQQIINGFN